MRGRGLSRQLMNEFRYRVARLRPVSGSRRQNVSREDYPSDNRVFAEDAAAVLYQDGMCTTPMTWGAAL